MTETVAATSSEGRLGRMVTTVARQREASLVAVMLILGVFVAVQAPQFLSVSNLVPVTVLASIIAIVAVGEALVIITRNVDLSVEAIMGLVAFSVAEILSRKALDAPAAMAFGVGLGLVLGMFNGFLVSALRVPAIVATLGTLSLFRGFDYLIAGGKQVTLTELPPGYTDPARWTIVGVPLFVLIAVAVVVVTSLVLRQTTFGRQVYAVAATPTPQPSSVSVVASSSSRCSPSTDSSPGCPVHVGHRVRDSRCRSRHRRNTPGRRCMVIGGMNIFGGSARSSAHARSVVPDSRFGCADPCSVSRSSG